tara:strand:+ start:1925 stop:2629 length:705 start_codon:yes stop_codon:yes gene_type:complete
MHIVTNVKSALKQCAAVILLCLCLPAALHATSVLQVDIDELLSGAGVIFEADVIASEARWNEDNTSISTWVTFAVVDVLKGALPADTITQSFAGGTVGETTLQVSGMVYPAVGERGIYFIENPDRQQVNPILGWGQGHFKVARDAHGSERVLTENELPVQAIEQPDPADKSGKRAQYDAALPLSEGAAQGLRVGKSQDARDTAMDKQDFKRALRTRLSLIQAEREAGGQADTRQ